ncbi:hypothetical protein EXE44_10810 [Halorubrum sp. SS7]|uniref:hypothetical protein n=3 Tax=unclassified Halorubrum TaxID=2642239 RepID=UPI0010F6FA8A|nr:hypothetical protein [Halorubrum sp. SS7]TKX57252.1 hypothetical protein EXE44_10810 [Halorubrum sp. SS7]
MSDSVPPAHDSTPAARTTSVTPSPTHEQQPQYECPVCEARYTQAVFTRVHLTRADDDAHDSCDGFDSDTVIRVTTAEGTTERQPDSPDTAAPTSVTREDFPDQLSHKEVSALLVATRNPTLSDRTALTERVHDALADTPWEPPIERTVNHAVTKFYHPHLCGDDATPTFTTLTTKQQAILITRLALPEASSETIATYTACSKNYPRKTCRNYADVLDALQARHDAGEDLYSIISTELPTAAREKLLATGQVAALVADEASGDEPVESPPEASALPSDTARETVTPDGSDDAAQTRLAAETPPDDSASDEDDEHTLSPSAFATAATLLGEQRADEADEADEPPVTTTCADELEDLARQVQFVKEAVSVTDPDRETTLLINLFAQIETRCRDLSTQLREA